MKKGTKPLVISVRVSPEDLAMASEAFIASGYLQLSRSFIVSRAFRDWVQTAIEQDLVSPIEDQTEAYKVLQRNGIDLNNRQEKRILTNIGIESYQREKTESDSSMDADVRAALDIIKSGKKRSDQIASLRPTTEDEK